MSFLATRLFGEQSGDQDEGEEGGPPVVGEGDSEQEGEDLTPRRSGRSKQTVNYNYN